jgi:hypothetical protein
MIKSRYIYNFSTEEWQQGKAFMLFEVAHLSNNHQIRVLLQKAIADFEAGKFSYDGATFVKERSMSLFEVAAFIHDWRNAMGYVSKEVDKEMFDIMNVLNYDLSLVFWRFIWTRFTFLNVYRHKIIHTFVASVPVDLYVLPKIK